MHGASSVVSSGVFLKVTILLPLISAVLLLLLMVASLVVWRMVKQQKKGEGTWLTLGWGWAGWKSVGLMARMAIREPSAQGNTCTVWKGCRPKGRCSWQFEGLELGGEPSRFWTQFCLDHPSMLFFFFKIYLFIYGCVGSSFLCESFL